MSKRRTSLIKKKFYFFIFNKIYYLGRSKNSLYYPSTVDIDRQIRRIGYCEGLVKFTEYI